MFSKFRLVKWGWLSGMISLLVGGFILATFLALFNYLTPSGRVTVTSCVVEVTPNVTGQIVAIPVKPNVPRCRFNTRSRSCRPRSPRRSSRSILKSNYEQATANVSGLTTQVAYNKKRFADVQTLAVRRFWCGWVPTRRISSQRDAKWSGCAKKARVFRLCCKIPIINLSEPV